MLLLHTRRDDITTAAGICQEFTVCMYCAECFPRICSFNRYLSRCSYVQGQVLGTGDTMGSYFHIVDNLRARDKHLVNEKARWENFSLNSQIRVLFLVNTHGCLYVSTHACTNIPAHIYVCANLDWLLLLYPHSLVAGLGCSWSPLHIHVHIWPCPCPHHSTSSFRSFRQVYYIFIA